MCRTHSELYKLIGLDPACAPHLSLLFLFLSPSCPSLCPSSPKSCPTLLLARPGRECLPRAITMSSSSLLSDLLLPRSVWFVILYVRLLVVCNSVVELVSDVNSVSRARRVVSKTPDRKRSSPKSSEQLTPKSDSILNSLKMSLSETYFPPGEVPQQHVWPRSLLEFRIPLLSIR